MEHDSNNEIEKDRPFRGHSALYLRVFSDMTAPFRMSLSRFHRAHKVLKCTLFISFILNLYNLYSIVYLEQIFYQRYPGLFHEGFLRKTVASFWMSLSRLDRAKKEVKRAFLLKKKSNAQNVYSF